MPESISEETNYAGPKISSAEEVNPEWCVEVMNWLKLQNKLHSKSVALILNKVRDISVLEPSVVDISIENEVEITVCGDIHG